MVVNITISATKYFKNPRKNVCKGRLLSIRFCKLKKTYATKYQKIEGTKNFVLEESVMEFHIIINATKYFKNPRKNVCKLRLLSIRFCKLTKPYATTYQKIEGMKNFVLE